MALSHDPLWPRAGGWPSFEETDGPTDAAILGVPAWKTSLSPTGAHATPAAVREALARYSATLMGPPPLDLGEALRIVDAGDVADPDGPEGEASVRARVASLLERTGLVVAIGGDNSLTYSVAQGAEAAGLITFDAHFDLRDGVSNGSPVRRLVADGLDGRRIVQIGIADFANSVAYARRAAEYGITVITLDDVRRRRSRWRAARAAASISTSTSTSAIGRSRPDARPRCRAGSRRGSCARSRVPWRPIRACAAPTSPR